MRRQLSGCLRRLAAAVPGPRAYTVLLPCAILLPQAGAQVHVPGDYAALQDAIDAVPWGATIVVHGGTHDGIRIERALTLVGEPEATIRTTCCQPGSAVELPAILLAGPGNGTVVLERIRTEGFVQDGVEGAGGAGIAGGGFDQLLVLHASISGSDGIDPFGGALLPGGPGIAVLLPYVLVADSQVRGGASNFPDFPGSTLKGTAGLYAPGASVTLLDSAVTGGSVDKTLFSPFTPCPPSCASIAGGSGGPGVVAGTVYRANSTVDGGEGSEFFCFFGGGVPLCKKPDGPATVADAVEDLSDGLTLSGPLLLGSTCQLTWMAGGKPALLLIGLGTSFPEDLPGRGLLFLDAYQASVLVVGSGPAVTETFAIPTESSLTGHVLTLQVYDPERGLTRPVVGALLP